MTDDLKPDALAADPAAADDSGVAGSPDNEETTPVAESTTEETAPDHVDGATPAGDAGVSAEPDRVGAAPTTESEPAAEPPAVAEEPSPAAAEPPAAAEEPSPAVAEEPPAAEEPAPAVAEESPARNSEPVAAIAPTLTPEGIGDIADELTAEDFASAIERTVIEFDEGDIVEGVVVKVDVDEVLVDIGFKSEGVIPARELSIRNDVNPGDLVSPGERIEALVLDKEDDEGRLILSKKRAQYERAWGKIEKVVAEGGTVRGPVIEVVKGGLIVDIGLRGFLPASLVELRRVRDLHPYIGQEIEAKVIELDRNRNNVVLSRRAHLEEEQADQRQAFLDNLVEGEVRTGTVSSVVNFGAFVDLGGMDGLVHVSELSWLHVNHPSEVVNVGDEVQVKVLEVDHDRERISLSIKQTQEDPWVAFSRDREVGDVVEGSVTKTVPFGAFVSVGDGVEGLVHVSEIAIHHVDSPELELSVGQKVQVKVTEVDEDRRRISLSIKQALPEWRERPAQPWEQSRPKPKREFEREEEAEEEKKEEEEEPAFRADASLEAILQELKEKGIGRR